VNDSGPDRREALRRLAAGAIGAVASPLWVQSLAALAQTHAEARTAAPELAAQAWTPKVFTARQNDAVVALTELIIPETDTPGAKAAMVNRFIDRVLADAPAAERDAFLRGLAWIDKTSRAEFLTDIAAATVEQQTALLRRIADDGPHAAGDATGVQFFDAIKSMTISGYYSTEIGLRQELGDDGQVMMVEFRGCDHPEHQ
jgi:glucoside 3-dehydrogenase (cytochrome c) hitch-hiker subunit